MKHFMNTVSLTELTPDVILFLVRFLVLEDQARLWLVGLREVLQLHNAGENSAYYCRRI
jgi:hypothetical protein